MGSVCHFFSSPRMLSHTETQAEGQGRGWLLPTPPSPCKVEIYPVGDRVTWGNHLHGP